MSPMTDWESWIPPSAPHVLGEYTKRVWDEHEKKHETQLVRMRCSKCGDAHQVRCDSGRVRAHISRYAALHQHGDVFAKKVRD